MATFIDSEFVLVGMMITMKLVSPVYEEVSDAVPAPESPRVQDTSNWVVADVEAAVNVTLPLRT